jgi:tetratricopeptide (TPR) repeat protein
LFVPPIGEFILATTANTDAKIQEVARRLTEDHRNSGLFSVSVIGWPDIHGRLVKLPAVLDLHYPQLGVTAHQTLATVSRVEETQSIEFGALHEGNRRVLAEVESLKFRLTALAEPNDDLDKELGAQLDQCKQLILQKRPRTALDLLDQLKARVWATAKANVKFRILTNSGASKLGLGDEAGAATDFLNAFDCDSSTEKAHGNRILGLLVRGEPKAAVEAGRAALDLFPKSPYVWANVIRTHIANKDNIALDDVLPPEVVHNEDVQFAVADYHGRRGNLPLCEEWLRKALKAEEPSVQVQMGLAECLASQVSMAGKLYPGSPLEERERAQLIESVALLRSVWSQLRGTEIVAIAEHLPTNLATILIVLGETTEALEIAQQGLERRPTSPELVRHTLRLLLDTRKTDDARKLLDRLGAESVSKYALYRAEVLRRDGDEINALEVLKKFIDDGPDSEERQIAKCFFLEIAVKHIGFSEAKAWVEATGPLDYRGWLALAAASKQEGDEERAQECLQRAEADIGSTPDSRAWLTLADLLFDWKHFDRAAEIYRHHCSSLNDSRSLRRYVGALMELDRRRELADVTSRLPESIKEDAFFQRVLGEMAFQAGDLPKARVYFEKCLQTDATDFRVRVRWAEVLLSLGQKDPVEQYLNRERSAVAQRSSQIIHLGRLEHLLGRINEAVALFYQARRRFPGSADAHLGLMSLLLSNQKLDLPQGPSTEVGPSMAFAIKDADGQARTYVIEDLPPEELLENEVPSDHPLAKRAKGLNAGKKVLLAESPFGREEGEILWVKHKYLNALHETMGTFETRFPESGALFRVRVPQGDKPEERLAPILKSVERLAKKAEEVEKFYTEKSFPLCVIAKLLGRASLDVWRSYLQSGKNIIVCRGSHEERKEGIATVESQSAGFILEPMSLFLLHSLSLLDAVVNVSGKLGLTKSTLDEYKRLIDERSGYNQGYLTIGKQEDQFVRQEITAEDVAKEVAQLRAILEWAENNCVIVPAIPKQDLTEAKASQTREVMGDAYYDTLLAANGSGRVLISDDAHLRALGKQSFGVTSVWTQPLLMVCAARKHLDSAKYRNTIVALLESNYKFTSIDADVIYQVARDGDWVVTPRFKRVVSTLEARSNEINALMVVLGAFLRRVWGTDLIENDQKRRLTFALLTGVNPGQSPNCLAMLYALGMRARAGHFPNDGFTAVVDWYEGHFLLLDFPKARSKH